MGLFDFFKRKQKEVIKSQYNKEFIENVLHDFGNIKELPEWFTGEVYDQGDTVTNPFSGSIYKLTAKELTIYDFIMGSKLIMKMTPDDFSSQNLDEYNKALSWLKSTNSKAYFVLFDTETNSLNINKLE
tara:strand:+ start:394 stop:780 length:387 start_codon:yes stop_codon:yes gene_type:complete